MDEDEEPAEASAEEVDADAEDEDDCCCSSRADVDVCKYCVRERATGRAAARSDCCKAASEVNAREEAAMVVDGTEDSSQP